MGDQRMAPGFFPFPPHGMLPRTLVMAKELALVDDSSCPAGTPRPQGLPPFAEVVNTHWSAVYRLLYTMTGNQHDTEDLTQETFLRALRKQETFQANTRLRSWLLRIATN